MTNSQGGSKGQQVNSSVKAEYQGDVSGFVSIRPGSQGDDESRTSRADETGQDKSNQVVAPPQQLQGSLVQWERFLHIRSIKVMLVEDDDCTRHIVTALLRNCNYEVIQATNGFQAWKILENLSNHIDIVLTEVVMPCVSGISLLCKIMSHKTRKNIPVIMMSSHDSMGLVFKCLSKGAVDFLVKPIRKNELKNLWQHVWRRCHSSSGSGSESGTQVQKSVNSKSNLRYDNNSKDGDDNGSSSGGSDDGSGTQSSWTKHTVEHERTESQKAPTPSNQISEHPDSTCGIVIRSQPTRDINNHKNNNEKDKEIAIENGKTEKIMNANANGIHDSDEVETGELGIKRARPFKNDATEAQNGCNVLRHSELSAFTRYNTTSNAIKGTPGITASCSQPENRSNSLKKESKRDVHSDGYIIYQGSSEQVIPRKGDEMTPGNVGHEELRIHHIHHHHHVHHYHNIETDEPLSSNHDEFGLKQLAADVPHCGSSNIMGGGPVVEPNLENYSLNKSASGSKHGSNVPNAVNFEVTKVESDVGLGEKSGSKIDHHDKSAQRKAALTKFRQKRELRCFQKKVRYQNRKKLAEQRPRVRGQFVKGSNSTNAADA